MGMSVFDAALGRLEQVYSEGHRVVVSFSAGKDSGVTLELALIAAEATGRLPVEVVLRDEEVMFPGTYEYAERVAARDDVSFHWVIANQPVLNVFNRPNPYWWVFDPLVPRDQWVREPPSIAYTIPDINIEKMTTQERFPPPEGKSLIAVQGLRTEESRGRLYGIHSSGGFMTKPHAVTGVRGCRPIYDWRDGDIWKAIHDFGWDYNCNPAEAPIWMGDYSFKPLGRVEPGDEVIGWAGDDGERERLCRATVLAVHRRRAPLVKVTMASGRTLRCTADHLWQVRLSEAGGNYRFAPAAIGKHLCHVVDPPGRLGYAPPWKARQAAWLGGLWDGEGCGDRLYQNPTHNPQVYAAIMDALIDLKLDFAPLNGRSAAQHGVRLTGGRAGLTRFLNVTDPVKRAGKQVDKLMLTGRFRTPDEVVSIEPDGEDFVYALTTTTGNYVAWGYASKNSAYDTLNRMGVRKAALRIGPVSMNAPAMDLLAYAQRAWPQWFDRAAVRLPGLRTAAQYGKRAITPERRKGESWKECFHRECIENAPPWIAERAREVERRYINQHAHHATTPLPDVKACPNCQGGNQGGYKAFVRYMYGGDPFALKYRFLPYVEPNFFRPGAGTWGGTPSW